MTEKNHDGERGNAMSADEVRREVIGTDSSAQIHRHRFIGTDRVGCGRSRLATSTLSIDQAARATTLS